MRVLGVLLAAVVLAGCASTTMPGSGCTYGRISGAYAPFATGTFVYVGVYGDKAPTVKECVDSIPVQYRAIVPSIHPLDP